MLYFEKFLKNLCYSIDSADFNGCSRQLFKYKRKETPGL
jgi:hypothetical protein